MNEVDRLIEILCRERGETPPALPEQRKPDYFRALCNVRPPRPVSQEFLTLQDTYLSRRTRERGVVQTAGFCYDNDVALWQGDITRLDADAIVNACNPALLGCFQPLHGCIDNVIHSCAGVQVRLDCQALMHGEKEAPGRVRVTKAYNLPSRYIFHTVGPVVYDSVTVENREDLQNCYLSCLEKARELDLSSLAFCCLSTGVYRFPKREACRIAVGTVKAWKEKNPGKLKIIFNVFMDEDKAEYERELL